MLDRKSRLMAGLSTYNLKDEVKREVIIMDNTNYFKELSNNYTGFRDIGNEFSEQDCENPMLKDLAKATYNALRIHFNALREARTKFEQYNATLGKQKKAEFLQQTQADALKGFDTFVKPIEQAAAKAREGYENARKVPEPENSVTYLRQQEVRSRLASMSLAERTAVLQDQAKEGNFSAFESVVNDPLPPEGFLGVPKESKSLLSDLAEAYAQTKYPEYCQRAGESEHLLGKATLIRDVAVASGLRQNAVQAG